MVAEVFAVGFGGHSIPGILKSPFIYDFSMTLDISEKYYLFILCSAWGLLWLIFLREFVIIFSTAYFFTKWTVLLTAVVELNSFLVLSSWVRSACRIVFIWVVDQLEIFFFNRCFGIDSKSSFEQFCYRISVRIELFRLSIKSTCSIFCLLDLPCFLPTNPLGLRYLYLIGRVQVTPKWNSLISTVGKIVILSKVLWEGFYFPWYNLHLT